ncbi:MAG: 50S ribosomal protein L1 [Thaumarchaeota archaeon]|nr:50S ribosomal protein L1 [Nitrososphaerota archaeon]
MDRDEILRLIREARAKAGRRGFKQSFDLYVVLDANRIKKEEIQLNEVVPLPHGFSRAPRVAVIAGGDAALRAKDAGADAVIPPEEMDRISTNRSEVRRLVKSYDFFLAEAALMPRVGRTLGRYLGPRGKMPIPVPSSSQMAAAIARARSSVRVRARGQFSLAVKVGDEGMSDEEIADNAMAVLEALRNKLPQGERAIRKVVVKATMGKPVEAVVTSA